MKNMKRSISQSFKIAFIRRHKELAKAAFKEGVALDKKFTDVRESLNVVALIKMARRELNYSPKTYDMDIFYSLLRTNGREEIV